ncbi:MAG: phage holin family protein [Proteobacteria bacterium]|nr:phage holin family protein [Pseudomonadota bacterium]
MHTLAHIVVGAIAVYVTAKVLPGVVINDYISALLVSVVLGVLNAYLRPLLFMLTIPVNIATLGLFTFVIIGGIVMLVPKIVPGFYVVNFWWALAFAGVLWLVNTFLRGLDNR